MHQRLARLVAVELAQPSHQGLGLPRRHASLHDQLGRVSLVAARQRRHCDRRARRQQPEPDVGLHGAVEPLDQQQPAADPALVPAQQLRHSALAQPVLATQRADDPGLLELGQLVVLVKRADNGGGHRLVERQHPDLQGRPAQPLRCAPSLEAVDQLQVAAVDERHHAGQLSMLGERATHPLVGRRLAQPQIAQALTEIMERDRLKLRLDGLHALI